MTLSGRWAHQWPATLSHTRALCPTSHPAPPHHTRPLQAGQPVARPIVVVHQGAAPAPAPLFSACCGGRSTLAAPIGSGGPLQDRYWPRWAACTAGQGGCAVEGIVSRPHKTTAQGVRRRRSLPLLVVASTQTLAGPPRSPFHLAPLGTRPVPLSCLRVSTATRRCLRARRVTSSSRPSSGERPGTLSVKL